MDRAHYYANIENHYELEKIRKCNNSEEIVKIMKHHKVDVNSYIKHPVKKGEWVPLIYFFSLNNKYQDVVKYLLVHKANPLNHPDGDDVEPLLFACHDIYLKHYLSRGCSVTCGNGDICNNIMRRLRCGDWQRLHVLRKHNIITGENISHFIETQNDVILHCLNAMKEYLIYVYNIKKSVTDKTIETTNTISKFITVTKMLLSWGVKVNDNVVDFCTDFYLYEFLRLPLFMNVIKARHDDLTKPVYHEHKDGLRVALLRPLLNDYRYEQTCDAHNVKPDDEIYAKISFY